MRGSFLAQGQSLSNGDFLVSAKGLFNVVVQTDGNFCVYRGARPIDDHGALWCSGIPKHQETHVFLSQEGKLFLFPGAARSSTECEPLWSSGRSGPKGDYFLVMQDDGNLCVYPGTGPDQNTSEALWCSGKTDKRPLFDYWANQVAHAPAADFGPKATGFGNRFLRNPPKKEPFGAHKTKSNLQFVLFETDEKAVEFLKQGNYDAYFTTGGNLSTKGAAGVFGGLFSNLYGLLLNVALYEKYTLAGVISENESVPFGEVAFLSPRSPDIEADQPVFVLVLESILLVKGVSQSYETYVHGQGWVHVGRTYGVRNKPGTAIEPAKTAYKTFQLVELVPGKD